MNIQKKHDQERESRTLQFLEEVEEKLEEALEVDLMLGEQEPRILRQAAQHLCLAGGKRARPKLVYLFGEAVGAPLRPLRDLALAAELIHTASLLHDDVIDAGTTRRGKPTVNAQWDNTVAVLAGDLLLTLAFAKLKPYDKEYTVRAVELVSRMTRASMMEVEARGRVELSVEAWKEIAHGKTGALFAWCGWAAAHAVENHDAAERFTRCAMHLGMAFQMADDLKDIHGDDRSKDRFADLKNGNPSYVLCDASGHSPGFREQLREAWRGALPLSPVETEALGQALLETGTGPRTVEALERESRAALEALGPFQTREGTADIVDWIKAMFFARS